MDDKHTPYSKHSANFLNYLNLVSDVLAVCIACTVERESHEADTAFMASEPKNFANDVKDLARHDSYFEFSDIHDKVWSVAFDIVYASTPTPAPLATLYQIDAFVNAVDELATCDANARKRLVLEVRSQAAFAALLGESDKIECHATTHTERWYLRMRAKAVR